MSVLVKDMKMPKHCLECPFEDSPYLDSYCIAIGYEFIKKWKDLGAYKPDWCPLQDAPTVGEWIPVSERLPEIHDEVLVTAHGEVSIAWLYLDGEWRSNDMPQQMFKDIIAWMPLPEPWKDGEE